MSSTQDRIYHALAEGIRSGTWAVGARLPTTRALAERWQCSITPVHRALKQLAQDGLVDLAHGSGARVQAPAGAALVAPWVTLLLAEPDPAAARWRTLQAAAQHWVLWHLGSSPRIRLRVQAIPPRGGLPAACAQLDGDGVVVVIDQGHQSQADGEILRALKRPIALFGGWLDEPTCDRVVSDFAQGTAELVRVLACHRPFRLRVPGWPAWERAKELGFRSAAPAGVSAESSADLGAQLAAARTAGHDLILAINDAQVATVRRAVRALGWQVPVAGYDATWNELRAIASTEVDDGPAPATVDRNLPVMAARLAELAVARACGELPPDPQVVLVPQTVRLGA